jgi:predicted 3-demethylubiquinone-9 3-methyltransferase (glyoxalase superfamily)
LIFRHRRADSPVLTRVDRQETAMAVSIAPHLWYSAEAEDAAAFYAAVIPNSRLDRVTALPVETPSGPPGSVKVVEFTLAGSPMMAISAGPLEPFNHAMSLMLLCDTQAEIDHLWDRLIEGGQAEMCGWLKDRYGLSWQIAPRKMGDWLNGERDIAIRVSQAMMRMVKFDLAALEAAAHGGS